MNVSAIGIGGKLLYASHVNLFLKNCFGVVFYFIIPAINIYSRHLKKTLLNVLLPLWTNLKKSIQILISFITYFHATWTFCTEHFDTERCLPGLESTLQP